MSGEGKVVCVTGGSGYIASWLVKVLLLRGYTVNATVRDTSDRKKVEHLVTLEGAEERLRLFQAELTQEGSFDAAVSGCDGVFHTASPCFFHSQDPQAELLDPAVKGTLNLLNSCAKYRASVKRVVLTSSMAALVCNKSPTTPEVVPDQSWVFDPHNTRKEKRWYALSKTLAEETAWKFAKEKDIDLVCINPGFVIGPLLQPKLNESCALYLNLIKGKSYSNVEYRTVNVKDVANAHVLAFETISASGRYCLVESVARVSDIFSILQQLYPTLPLPHECSNNNPPGKTCLVSNEKARSLGINFIPLKSSLKEMIDSCKERNFISF